MRTSLFLIAALLLAGHALAGCNDDYSYECRPHHHPHPHPPTPRPVPDPLCVRACQAGLAFCNATASMAISAPCNATAVGSCSCSSVQQLVTLACEVNELLCLQRCNPTKDCTATVQSCAFGPTALGGLVPCLNAAGGNGTLSCQCFVTAEAGLDACATTTAACLMTPPIF